MGHGARRHHPRFLLCRSVFCQAGYEMKAGVLFILLILFLFWASGVKAFTGTAVYESGSLKVRLLTAPCAKPEMVTFFAKYTAEQAREAVVVYHGRLIHACWVGLMSQEG